MRATEERRLVRMIHRDRKKLGNIHLPTGQFLNEDHLRASRTAAQAYELFSDLADKHPLPVKKE